MPVHQAAKFSKNPKKSHGTAVKRTVKYLKGTDDMGLILKPDLSKGLEVYVDEVFAGSCEKDASEDPYTVHSRTGFII